jgi:hypothetical protein
VRSILLVTAVSSVQLVSAVQRINVAVCNMDAVGESDVSNAKTETELIYRAVGVQIVWWDCGPFPASSSPERTPWFVIRLRNDKPPSKGGSASLDVMGLAFVEGREGGATADAYLRAIRATAERQHTDAGVLLGFVLAHELGHLILGPGHTPVGLMQAVWGEQQIDDLRQRRLRFSREGGERIRLALKARTGTRDRGHWGWGVK